MASRFSALDNLFEGGLKVALSSSGSSNTTTDWAVGRIEELLRTPQVFARNAFIWIMDFVEMRGGDEYFITQ